MIQDGACRHLLRVFRVDTDGGLARADKRATFRLGDHYIGKLPGGRQGGFFLPGTGAGKQEKCKKCQGKAFIYHDKTR